MSEQPSSIATHGRVCIKYFDQIILLLNDSSQEDKAGIKCLAVRDELSRFKLWAGNIGALQDSHRKTSLEFRLRKTPRVVTHIIKLLSDLISALKDLAPIASGTRKNRQSSFVPYYLNDDLRLDKASSLAKTSTDHVSETEILLHSVSNTITSLFQLSAHIRQASPRDRYQRAAILAATRNDAFQNGYDSNHVKEKFPRLANEADSWLVERLGQAITLRREYLRYCSEHQEHFKSDLTKGDPDETPDPNQGDEINMPIRDDINTLPETFVSSLIPEKLEEIGMETGFDDGLSQTTFDDANSQVSSYASSIGIGEEMSDRELRLPKLDNVSMGKPEFECPYCHIAQKIQQYRLWKRHAFYDLRPYVCTFKECDLKMFSSRTAWFDHEHQLHRVQWLCPFCSNTPYTSLQSFHMHIQKDHAQSFTQDQLEALASISQRPLERFQYSACPLCLTWETNLQKLGKLTITPTQFRRHLGGHMEQLALFAIRREDYPDEGDASISDGSGEDEASLDPEASEVEGYRSRTALHRAASEGDEGAVRELLEAKSDVDAKDSDRETALHWAAKGGHEVVVRLLLEAKADLNAKNSNGETALHWAAQSGHEMVMRLLLKAGADVNAKNFNGETALQWAARNRHEAVVRLLVEAAVDADSKITLKSRDYTVGWICALQIEMAAARAMLDEFHNPLPQDPLDENSYTLGRIGGHNVVLACLPAGITGMMSAARVATQTLSSFQSLRFGLMVGIGSGVPSEQNDIRLGDVVVSKPTGSFGGVIQYDFVKTVQEGRFLQTGSLNGPPSVLLNALVNLQAKRLTEDHELSKYLSEMIKRYPKMRTQFTYPGAQNDLLFEAEYDHPSENTTCSQCDGSRLISRVPRASLVPAIHYGLIASGNQVMKHGATRDRLRREHDVLCYDVEAAGLMDQFPCVVIRGICDYADSHKNKGWQPYAAAIAAAYAKELLSVIPGNQVINTRTAAEVANTAGESSS